MRKEEISKDPPILRRHTHPPERVEIRHPENVRWNCVRCHACCGDTAEHIRHIRMLHSEVLDISRLTKRAPGSFCFPIEGFERFKFEMQKQASGDCVFLNADTCTIYGNRPLTCRFYPFSLKQSSENEFEFCLTDERCPGLGQEPLLDDPFYIRLFRTASKKISRQHNSWQSF